MMKIIHCADVHLGSKMEAKLPKNKAEERRIEVRKTFQNMVEYAKMEGVRAIILAGDVFDSDRPFKRDKEFFYEVVKATPEIDFLYLRGNHDGKESYVEDGIDNLKTFQESWTSYDYDEVRISGIEIGPANALSLYATLSLEEHRKNIVVLHGQTGSVSGVDKINLNKLVDKNIDYLALGHIHSFEENKLDDRGRYAYSGCLEGRGFDECGEKGFVLLELEEQIHSRFVPFAKRKIQERFVDISATNNRYEAYLRAKEKVENAKDLYRLILIGEVAYESDGLAEEIAQMLDGACYFVNVKNKTTQKLYARDYEGDTSLRGEFVRKVLQKDWSEEKKYRVLQMGLKALSRREVD